MRWGNDLIGTVGPSWSHIAKDRKLWQAYREELLLRERETPWLMNISRSNEHFSRRLKCSSDVLAYCLFIVLAIVSVLLIMHHSWSDRANKFLNVYPWPFSFAAGSRFQVRFVRNNKQYGFCLAIEWCQLKSSIGIQEVKLLYMKGLYNILTWQNEDVEETPMHNEPCRR